MLIIVLYLKFRLLHNIWPEKLLDNLILIISTPIIIAHHTLATLLLEKCLLIFGRTVCKHGRCRIFVARVARLCGGWRLRRRGRILLKAREDESFKVWRIYEVNLACCSEEERVLVNELMLLKLTLKDVDSVQQEFCLAERYGLSHHFGSVCIEIGDHDFQIKLLIYLQIFP